MYELTKQKEITSSSLRWPYSIQKNHLIILH